MRLTLVLVALAGALSVVPVTEQTVLTTKVAACSPNTCSCSNTTTGYLVNCRNLNPKLLEVPHSIPEATQVLSLAQNYITMIKKGDFNRLEQLRSLFLELNSIQYIQPGAFDNLNSLEALVMYDNALTRIPETMFQHLPSLITLDLGRNRISFVEKRAFLTLPASNKSQNSDITIRMNGNTVNCNCDVLAIREWRKTLAPSGLPTINFESFLCAGSQGIELDSMNRAAFPSCTAAQLSMFESNQTCIECSGVTTQHSCDSQTTKSCTVSQPVCHSQMRMKKGRLNFVKSCGVSYKQCLLYERNNRLLCRATQGSKTPYLLCNYCCVGNLCNQGDVGGRTVSYKLYVGLRVNRQFQPYMHDPTSSNYIQDAGTYAQRMTNIFSTIEGGFDVRFISFRNQSPGVFVSLVVFTTTLSMVELGELVQLMTQQINASAVHGFLKEQGVSFIYVGNQLATITSCAREVLTTEVGVLDWPETQVDTTAAIACPQGTVLNAYTSRRCFRNQTTGAGQWSKSNLLPCKKSTSETTRKLLELSNTKITAQNVGSVLTQLDQVTSDASALTANDVTLAMDTVDKALASTSTLRNPAALGNAVNVLSNLMNADQEVLDESNAQSQTANRLLAAADKMAAEGSLSNGELMLSADNLVVAAQQVDPNNFNGLSITAEPTGNDGAFEDGDVEVHTTDSPPAAVEMSSLVLPPSVMDSASGTRVAMTVHRDDKIFKAVQRSKTGSSITTGDSQDVPVVTKVNSYVMAASVVGSKVDNLQKPVTYTLVHNDKNATNPRCVFWDVAAADWSSRGCSKVVASSNKTVTTCQCDHLTNFALLMDVYKQGEGLSKTDAKILSYLSYIGCGVSLFCLLLTLLTYCLFKKLRRDNPSKILVNLCVALALSNLVFVVGMHPYALDNTVGCKIVAVLLHFSLLSSLCWMAVEAFYMYVALVLVFKTYFTKFLLKCSLVGWGIPLLIVVITLGVNKTDNYASLGTGVCWLQGVAFYVAFVGPVGLIILVNILAFIMVVYQITGMRDRKLNKSDSFSVLQRLRGAVGVAILLGLTWVFGFLSVTEGAAAVFYYLFTITNCLQGLWIFLFYCVMKKEARKSWLRCCRDTQADKSGVTTSRAAYTGTQAGGRGAGASSSSSAGNTASSNVTKSFNSDAESEATYVNGNVTPRPVHRDPVYDNNADGKKPAADTKHVHLNLGDDSTSKVKVTVASTTTTTSARPIQFHEGQTLTEPKEEKLGSPGPSDDPRASPRPLHFKLGYAYSLEPKPNVSGKDESSADPGSPTDQGTDRSSVAAMVHKLNNRA